MTTPARKRATRKWKAANPEKLKAMSRGYLSRNRERMRAGHRKYMGLPDATRPAPTMCECCGQPDKAALCLDHDHKTGKFRGWLCKRCNSAIGLLGDSLCGVLCAVDYLVSK
jgi:Recombination endonuclease VII